MPSFSLLRRPLRETRDFNSRPTVVESTSNGQDGGVVGGRVAGEKERRLSKRDILQGILNRTRGRAPPWRSAELQQAEDIVRTFCNIATLLLSSNLPQMPSPRLRCFVPCLFLVFFLSVTLLSSFSFFFLFLFLVHHHFLPVPRVP
jgi:hypothetical protein